MEYIERTISYFTQNIRGHDAKLFTKGAAYTSFPTPTISVTSPDCGPSGSKLDIDHTQDGRDLIPSLSWSLPASIASSSVKEYLVVVQDADVPIPFPIMHAAYYAIPASKTSITPGDLEKEGKEGHLLKGGFKYAKNLRGTVYSGPKPLKGHGEHRYFYMVTALSESLVGEKKALWPKKDDLEREVQGKVLGWGEWVGVAVRD